MFSGVLPNTYMFEIDCKITKKIAYMQVCERHT